MYMYAYKYVCMYVYIFKSGAQFPCLTSTCFTITQHPLPGILIVLSFLALLTLLVQNTRSPGILSSDANAQSVIEMT